MKPAFVKETRMPAKRPPKADSTTVGFSMPTVMVEALDGEARRMRMNRSEMVRDLLTAAMLDRGLWPPKPAQQGAHQ